MDKLELLFSDLKAEYAMLLGGVARKAEELDKKIKAKDIQKAELDKREKDLELLENDYAKRSVEVNERYTKILSEEQLRAKIEEYNTLVGTDLELVKAAQEANSEATIKLEELTKREYALSEEKKIYKEKIKNEITSKLLG